VVGLTAGIAAVLQLGPRVVSLMPGLMRASLAAKMLFPGARAPGWLTILVAPFYALLVFFLLIMPYQVTGSPFFVLAIAGFVAAPLWQARMGLRLIVPMVYPEARQVITRARNGYLVANLLGVIGLVGGLWTLARESLQLGILDVLLPHLALTANVMLLTVIGSDTVLAGMERARQVAADPRADPLRRDSDMALAAMTQPLAPAWFAPPGPAAPTAPPAGPSGPPTPV
jgi:hypothetical protein